jgi:hypothetical protein
MQSLFAPLPGYQHLENTATIWNPTKDEPDLFMESSFRLETHLQYMEGSMEVLWYEDMERKTGPRTTLNSTMKGRFYVDHELGSPQDEMAFVWQCYRAFRVQNFTEKLDTSNAQIVKSILSGYDLPPHFGEKA